MTHVRVRGFAKWSPRAATRGLLGQVHEVLEEYREHLPLTLRQVFYRLVALGLPSAPAKTTDRRSFNGIGDDANATVQAEAIPPDELARIVQAAIDSRLDYAAHAVVLDAEKHAKAELAARMELRP